MDCEPKQRIASKLKGKHAKKGSGQPLSYSIALEDKPVQWIFESRDLQLPVQRKAIQQKAVALIQPINPEFRASDGWLQKFMTRNSLLLRRHTSIQQKLPGDLEKKLEEFMSSVQALRKHHDFPSDLIINMDETPIF